MKHISWNTTKKCNLYCDHCYRSAGPNEKLDNELSIDEAKKMLDQIAKTNFDVIVFSGGEPLMRDDIFDLIKYSSSLGLIPAMGSNGTLITKEIAKELKSSGLKSIAISLDSLEASRHDDFRKSAGSHSAAIKGIKNSIDAGLRVQINPTVTKKNKNEIIEIINYAASIGVSSCHVFFLVETGRAKKEDALSIKEYKDVINEVLNEKFDIFVKPTCAPQYMVEALEKDIKTRASRGCIAGISYCNIGPNGDVYICPYADVKVDSIRNNSFDYIWENNEIFKKLRNFNNYEGKCSSCSHINICGGCRARAFSKTENYLGEDPYCLLDIV